MALISRFLLALLPGLALLGFAVSSAHADGEARFSLQPVTMDAALRETRAYFVFDAQPGAALTSAVRISNAGTAAGTARLYAVDAATSQMSGIVMLAHDAPRTQVGTWVSLDVAEVTLTPGQSQVVAFRVSVPAGVRAGHHVGGLVVEGLAPPALPPSSGGSNDTSFQVTVSTRTAVAVQVNVAGAQREQLDVRGITAGGDSGNQTLALDLRNSGTVMLKPTGSLRVVDAQGAEVQHLALTLDTLLPETQIAYPVYMERAALASGAYKATVTLGFGDGQELQQALAFTISPAQAAQVFEARQPLAPPPTVAASTSEGGFSIGGWPLVFAALGLLVLLLTAGGGALVWRRRA